MPDAKAGDTRVSGTADTLPANKPVVKGNGKRALLEDLGKQKPRWLKPARFLFSVRALRLARPVRKQVNHVARQAEQTHLD